MNNIMHNHESDNTPIIIKAVSSLILCSVVMSEHVYKNLSMGLSQ